MSPGLPAWGWAVTALGTVLLLVALVDVFRTLWHPTDEGPLTRAVGRAVWLVTGWPGGRAARDVAGPLVLVGVVVVWALLVTSAAALVYWPHLERGGFSYGAGLEPEQRSGPVDALYVSAVVLSTLGLGDVVPQTGWLRLATAAEALLGFSLLTAAVTWVLQLQGALVRRRTLARTLAALQDADPAAAAPVPAAVLTQVLRDLAGVHVDLRQSAPTYYFRDPDARGSLAVVLPYVRLLAHAAALSPDPAHRLLGAALDGALRDLVALLAGTFLPRARSARGRQDGRSRVVRRTGPDGWDEAAVLAAYARDQGHDGGPGGRRPPVGTDGAGQADVRR